MNGLIVGLGMCGVCWKDFKVEESGVGGLFGEGRGEHGRRVA